VAGLATGDTIFFDAFFLGRPIVPSGGPVFVPQGVSRACIR
jgi:hypothetical protein